jgi:glycosyltransferase involved in cell wall biosynthesis
VTRVAFLVEELGRSGGMAVIRRHARHLREVEGMDVELVVCGPRASLGDEAVPVRRLADVRDYDVAIATWWTTADALFELEARRRVVYLQNLEFRFYREHELADRLGAMSVLDLPVDYVVVASHMQALLAELRPQARVVRVAPGIDKDVFREAPPRAGGDSLRVLVEGQPTLWFKAVPEAVAVARSAGAEVTVATHDPSLEVDADRVVGGLSGPEMAALYAEHDVLLRLARFEGLGLPPLEAFHVGVPCVLTPFTGSEDYARHEQNALVVGFDDEAATVAALQRLRDDAGLRARLREGELATARDWPDERAAGAAFAEALRGFLAEEPPSPDEALRRMARTRRLAIELERPLVTGAASWRDKWALADQKNAEYDRWAKDLQTHIDALHARPGYRVEQGLKRLLRRR